ncbi:hypothetical protein IFM89_005868 [Coptis chinensis]|uniref:Methionine aminopeptidase n=1 Tax=Coptis chinensis TaxID=261450 RepID=A0A835HL51_9MAGN|nr:hypothetical protein IFM89_005868 [Coptis chinensis]
MYGILLNSLISKELAREHQFHDSESIIRMKAACELVARVLDYAGTLVKPSVTTDEIDKAVHKMVIDAGAYPSPLGYGGFPKSFLLPRAVSSVKFVWVNRSFLRSTTFRTASKATRCPFQLPKQNPLASRIFRSPVELSCVVKTLLPFHTATTSTLLTSMLFVSQPDLGWLPEGSYESSRINTTPYIVIKGWVNVRWCDLFARLAKAL